MNKKCMHLYAYVIAREKSEIYLCISLSYLNLFMRAHILYTERNQNKNEKLQLEPHMSFSLAEN